MVFLKRNIFEKEQTIEVIRISRWISEAKLFVGYACEVLEHMKKITMKMKGNSIHTVEMNKGIHVYLTN